MSRHAEMLVVALANAAPKREPGMVVGGTLELAVAECSMLHRVLLQNEQGEIALIAAAIEGRLRALDRLVGECMAVTWKDGAEVSA